MAHQGGFIITLLVGKDLNAQAALLIREQRHLQVVDRAGSEGVSDRLNASKIQLVVEDFNVEHRAKQRFVAAGAPAVTHDLLGVVTLMAAHLFHLPGQALGQLRQRLLRPDVHRQRQHVQHRASGRQGRRSHPAHKDKARGIVHAPGQAGEPQGHQRQGEVGALALAGSGQLAEGVTIGGQLQAQNIGRGSTPW